MLGAKQHEEVKVSLNDLDASKKKRIVNLNKNVMSVLLPYLQHDELLKVE
jgi:hypothetical protein